MNMVHPELERTRAFTLVELMVVLGVVAVLTALLLPVLTAAKAATRRIQCVSNLRQLGLAAQLYWMDNEGTSFRYKGAFTNGGDLYWFGWLERGGAEGQRRFDPTSGALYPYILGRGVEICSSLNYRSSHFKLKATGAAYGYGYNTNLSASVGQRPLVVEQLPDTSRTALMADAAQVNTFLAPASPDNPMLEEFYYINEQEPTVHFRHQRMANIVFCDGHVGREGPVPGSIDQKLPSEHVGRLPSALLRGR